MYLFTLEVGMKVLETCARQNIFCAGYDEERNTNFLNKIRKPSKNATFSFGIWFGRRRRRGGKLFAQLERQIEIKYRNQRQDAIYFASLNKVIAVGVGGGGDVVSKKEPY